MYKLPKDFDAGFLIGKTIEMVCFTANMMSLHFDASIQISVEGQFSYGSNQAALSMSQPPVAQSNLMSSIGAKVISAYANDKSDLTLSFDNGAVFVCHDNSPHYESYQIRNGSTTIIV